ncbi:hypothetical protein [Gryllotalpicola sp.]|uniref:hypothetical protein n=1 Tax=Gryllotalpicola sp. TaxID=1932787 RepID=UPI00261BF993|nr:hypothetical protein [Gryllotalpicola sp.]
MTAAVLRDRGAIARVGEAHGVARLHVFGSAVADRFDPASSEVGFLVDFKPGTTKLLHEYLSLRADLVAAATSRHPAAEVFCRAPQLAWEPRCRSSTTAPSPKSCSPA